MMTYMVRRGARYFARPVNIDDDSEEEITRDQFYKRWRQQGGSAADIASAKALKGDFDVL